MALIFARSPYLVSRDSLDEGAQLKLEIGDYDADSGGFEVEKTFIFNYRNAYYLDVSPFLKDYLDRQFSFIGGDWVASVQKLVRYCRITLSGNISGVAQSDVVTEHYFTSGYLYSTDDFNKDFTSDLEDNCYYAGSSDVIYKLDNSNTYISYLCPSDTLIASGSATQRTLYCSFLNNGNVVHSTSIDLPTDLSSLNGNQFSDFLSFLEWGYDSDMVDEETYCSEKFLRNKSLNEVDQIILACNGINKVIEVKSISECHHKPYRIRFVNRYGMYDYVWFFKRSTESMSISKETYRSNSIQLYTSGNGVKTFTDFNVNGRDSITLNTGFVDERMNESFKQLMLSENLQLYDFETKKTYNVNIVNSDFQFKTHLNDKLINYTIELQMAHEVINNVG